MINSLFGFFKLLGGISEKNLVNIDINKCLRHLNKNSTCSKCHDNCPAGAITIDGQEIKVEGFLCTGCGICVNACSNPVFSLEDIEPSSIIKGAKDGEQVTISCFSKDTNIQVPCLGFVNEAVLVRMVCDGGCVVLDTSACRKCDYSTAYDNIIGHVEAARSFLTHFNVGGQIKIKEEDTAYEPEHESFTRKFITKFSDTKLENGSSRQSILIDAIKILGQINQKTIDANIVPFGSIHVRESCNGCNMCVAICPMDAISVEQDNDLILKFKSQRCTGCGLCSQLCPVGAIDLDLHIDLNELIMDEWRTIMEIRQIKCEACGKLFVMSNGQVLCASCLRNKDIEDSFFLNKSKNIK